MSISICEIGKRIYDLSNPREKRRYYVFLLRFILRRGSINNLIEFFENQDMLKVLLNRAAYPIEQVTRSFFYNGSTFQERSNLIKTHYTYLLSRLKKESFLQICDYHPEQRFVIWESEFEEKKLRAELTVDDGQRKEGCLSVIIKWDDRDLYQIIFWLNRNSVGEMALWIGAMQGPNLEDARNVVKRLTKFCHGYRTKNLVLYMVQAVVRSMGLKKIYAVSNYGYYANNHVRADRKLKTNFGDFWLEAGGQETEDKRFFEVPVMESRKSMEEVPTRKRAVYRRRFAFLDEVDEVIAERMLQILK